MEPRGERGAHKLSLFWTCESRIDAEGPIAPSTASSCGDAAKDASSAPPVPSGTWFYGHEPTNLFCTHVAKYFSNALREDGLLAVARHGVVFAHGGPGTMQEVFQDACQNAYGTVGDVSPMVFLGQRYWTQDRPALALMRSMTTGMQLAERFAAFDDIDAIVAFLKAHPPVPYRK